MNNSAVLLTSAPDEISMSSENERDEVVALSVENFHHLDIAFAYAKSLSSIRTEMEMFGHSGVGCLISGRWSGQNHP